jgi:hypothetical protein
MSEQVPRVMIGMDPHKRSVTIEEGDARLHERVKNREQAVFANLQLACSFHPTDEWVFSSARLTVILARVDGLAAPAPIAYSLLPLLEHDGSAHEQSVDIGADMKFVSVKGGEKSTIPGEVFVRGYGLQESLSYWEFAATPHRPLQRSFLLWLIERAPRESDLMVTSSLQVRVAPRRMWSRADSPSVVGAGEVALTLGLKNRPPYTARLGGSAPHSPRNPGWWRRTDLTVDVFGARAEAARARDECQTPNESRIALLHIEVVRLGDGPPRSGVWCADLALPSEPGEVIQGVTSDGETSDPPHADLRRLP